MLIKLPNEIAEMPLISGEAKQDDGCLAGIFRRVTSIATSVFEKIASLINLELLEVFAGVLLVNHCFPSQSLVAGLTTALLVGVGIGIVNLSAQKFQQKTMEHIC